MGNHSESDDEPKLLQVEFARARFWLAKRIHGEANVLIYGDVGNARGIDAVVLPLTFVSVDIAKRSSPWFKKP